MKSLVNNAVGKEQKAPEAKQTEEFAAPKIMVMGIGGAGNNSVNRISAMGVSGAELVAINTDRQHLGIISDDITKLLIGKSITNGLGAGAYPDIGAKAAEITKGTLEEVLDGVDMLFITAGMGGGTGTGAGPVVAEIAKAQGAIVVAITTFPFSLEKARSKKAEEGIDELTKICDTVVVIDNNRLVELVPNLPMQDAFKVADEVIARTIRGITETITQPSLINLDYADIRTVMGGRGLSMIAVGEGQSNSRTQEVVKDTLNNMLLDVDIQGAKGCLIHITGGTDLTLGEANEVGELLTDQIDPNANVIWGSRVDPTFDNKIEVIAIFTGVSSPFIRGSKRYQGQSQSSSQENYDDEFGLSSL